MEYIVLFEDDDLKVECSDILIKDDASNLNELHEKATFKTDRGKDKYFSNWWRQFESKSGHINEE